MIDLKFTSSLTIHGDDAFASQFNLPCVEWPDSDRDFNRRHFDSHTKLNYQKSRIKYFLLI